MDKYRVKVTDENTGHEEYGEAQIVGIPVDQWEQKIDTLTQEGQQFAQELHSQGHPFQVRVLAPREVSEPGEGVSMTAVTIAGDWKARTKLAMVEDANAFLTKAYQLGIFSKDLAKMLAAAIEEKTIKIT